ncbi:hypothetical protein Pme01_08580 [Planosporangium mesophilum]|uniref:Uncharacterized protein n=1 Tax=Planosporangium mesophilum TaxID=689768 RepID=A0A8J3WZ55_9ACTN|nr:hypothetical protein Pme01_08580 [Planosporangium mesophilum]
MVIGADYRRTRSLGVGTRRANVSASLDGSSTIPSVTCADLFILALCVDGEVIVCTATYGVRRRFADQTWSRYTAPEPSTFRVEAVRYLVVTYEVRGPV